MNTDSPRAAIWRHVSEIRTCMLTTRRGDRIVARPMTCIVRPEQNLIWFFADQSSDDHPLEDNAPACLAFADLQSQTYVSLSGRLKVVHDQAMIEGLWSEAASIYFPQGPDDPKLTLLKFQPETGEYWDSPSSRIVLAIKFIEAKLTGERPELGDHGTARLT